MAIIVKDNGKDFERVEPGLHHGVCSHVVDLGLQETKYGLKSKVAICFELEDKMQDGRPFMQSGLYTASLNEKATLRQQLEGWRGVRFTDDEIKGFDIERLVGVNAMLNIVEDNKNGKTYTNITSISKPPKGFQQLKPVGQEAPEWLRKMAEAGKAREVQMNTPVPPATDVSPHNDSDFFPADDSVQSSENVPF